MSGLLKIQILENVNAPLVVLWYRPARPHFMTIAEIWEREKMEIRIRDDCPDCQGKGMFNRPGCGKCANFFDENIDTEERFLPCGHPRTELVYEWTCLDCLGTGKVESWITVDEWIAKVGNIQIRQTR